MNSKCLGLPLHIKRARHSSRYLKESLISYHLGRLNSYSKQDGGSDQKCGSFPAILYTMSTFLFAKSISNRMDVHFSDFWWGSSSTGQKSLRFKYWDALCVPKQHGGLGFRKMFNHNLALLSKRHGTPQQKLKGISTNIEGSILQASVFPFAVG